MDGGNLFDNIPPNLPEELIETLLEAAGLRVERIVSKGQTSPPGFWYDQPWHEWVLVLRGGARLEVAGEAGDVTLRPGDYLLPPIAATASRGPTRTPRPSGWRSTSRRKLRFSPLPVMP